MSVPSKSGRINLLDNKGGRSYKLTQQKLEISEMGNGNIGHYMEESNLSNFFFGKKNIDALQDYIQFKVFKETKKRISRQSDMELLVIMRSIFFSNAKHINCDILEQVKELNEIVIKSAIGSIISNMQQYEQYKKDASSGIKVMEPPVFVSEKGRGPNEFPKF
tara:strand:+ start:2086 stop:2574 length:489 start_codon:yes stop_codon:yes gene_type:complete